MMDLVAEKSVEGQEPLVIHEPETGIVAFMEKSDVKSLGTGYEYESSSSRTRQNWWYWHQRLSFQYDRTKNVFF